jgi:hypothetical protein
MEQWYIKSLLMVSVNRYYKNIIITILVLLLYITLSYPYSYVVSLLSAL